MWEGGGGGGGGGGAAGSIRSFSNVIRKTGTILVALRTFA